MPSYDIKTIIKQSFNFTNDIVPVAVIKQRLKQVKRDNTRSNCTKHDPYPRISARHGLAYVPYQHQLQGGQSRRCQLYHQQRL